MQSNVYVLISSADMNVQGEGFKQDSTYFASVMWRYVSEVYSQEAISNTMATNTEKSNKCAVLVTGSTINIYCRILSKEKCKDLYIKLLLTN